MDSEAYNSVGGYVFGELGRLPKRGDMVQANGYSLRVESVRAEPHRGGADPRPPRRDERPDRGPPRPVEEAAATPRGPSERRAAKA